LNAFAGEVTRVAREVGTEGKLGGQAVVRGVAGTWEGPTHPGDSMGRKPTRQGGKHPPVPPPAAPNPPPPQNTLAPPPPIPPPPESSPWTCWASPSSPRKPSRRSSARSTPSPGR